MEEKQKAKKKKGAEECICSWETFLCCEVMKKTYFETMSQSFKSRESGKGDEHAPDNGAHKEQDNVTVAVNQKAMVDPG